MSFGVESTICTVSAFAALMMTVEVAGLQSSFGELLLRSFGFAVVIAFSMIAMGLYRNEPRGGLGGIALRLGLSFILSVALLTALFRLFPETRESPLTLIFVFFLGLLGVGITRALLIRMMPRRLFSRRILVIGSGENAKSVWEQEESIKNAGGELVGFVCFTGTRNLIPSLKAFDIAEPIADFARQHSVHAVSYTHLTLPTN